MRYDLRNAPMKHACNLGGLLAAQIAHMAGVKAYIADPPVVDEMDDAARITGMPMCPRKPSRACTAAAWAGPTRNRT